MTFPKNAPRKTFFANPQKKHDSVIASKNPVFKTHFPKTVFGEEILASRFSRSIFEVTKNESRKTRFQKRSTKNIFWERISKRGFETHLAKNVFPDSFLENLFSPTLENPCNHWGFKTLKPKFSVLNRKVQKTGVSGKVPMPDSKFEVREGNVGK